MLSQVMGLAMGCSSTGAAVEARRQLRSRAIFQRRCLLFIRYVNNIIIQMAASPQPSKRKEQMSALIEQEWSLVLTGKAASKLTDLIYNYEMDLLTNPLQKNPSLVEKYVTGLLLTGDYLELSLFLARTKDVPNREILERIAQTGKMEKLKELGVAADVYISKAGDDNLKERLRETTLHSILKVLSKYFLNYRYSDLKGLFNASEEDIRHLGFTLTGGFIEMKVEEVHSDCLLTKLRELAIVANKMNKFE